jgi:hypothetical protein
MSPSCNLQSRFFRLDLQYNSSGPTLGAFAITTALFAAEVINSYRDCISRLASFVSLLLPQFLLFKDIVDRVFLRSG